MSADLLARVEAFDIDGPDPPAQRFAARLARENGWPRPFADRAVREYKRFVYLAMTAGEPVCPSEQVDAVWHQHLTYTRSYWKRFCGEVLGRPLHHDPTKGGPAEADKHRRMYAVTLAAYRRAFGEDAPPDLWPDADTRFGRDLRHVVVNAADNWVVPKAWVRRAASGVVAAGLLIVAGAGAGGGLNPFNLVGTDYLVFLIPVMLAALCLGLLIRNVRKGPGFATDEVPALGWEEAAYLGGNYRRMATAGIARLVEQGAAEVSESGESVRRVGPPFNPSPVEAAVYAALPLRKDDRDGLKALAAKVQVAGGDTARRLEDAGLVFTPGQRFGVGLVSVLPLVGVLLVFGVTRLVLGLGHGKPSDYLALTLAIGAGAALILMATRPTRTRKGDQTLAALQTRHVLLKHGTTRAAEEPGQAGMAVALFGTAALAGSTLAVLHQWYPKQTDGGGGCGAGCSGGGCGGGGCGGGGCGGCGGGD
ncbi:MAG: TIGR04222 domain-containing membrane protein [Gemmataceae bacterium]